MTLAYTAGNIALGMETEPKFMDPNTQRLRDLIKAEREQLELTQDGLAERFGIAQASISQWENGQKVPSLPSLLKLRDAFGLTDAEFAVWIDLAGRKRTGEAA